MIFIAVTGFMILIGMIFKNKEEGDKYNRDSNDDMPGYC